MSAQRLLLLIPPLTQLNTPYPSTAYLTGFLKQHGYATGEAPVSAGAGWAGVVTQADVGIEMVLALLSRDGLTRVFDRVRDMPGHLPGEAGQMLALEQAYLDSINAVVRFLQGQDPTLAPRICQGRFLPQGPRFAHVDEQSCAFGTLGMTDRARYLATLYLEDLADLIHETVAPQFALSRYAEHVGVSASSFDAVACALAEPPSLTDEMLLDAVWLHVEAADPTLIGLTVPFPGNLYGALRIAQAVKARRPDVRVTLGGGFVNTELRCLQEPRLFDYVDYVTLDDGERPLLCLLEHLAGKRDEAELRRTFVRAEGHVVWRDGAREPEFGMAEIGTPTYAGLVLTRYLSVLDTLNPMHRLWSDGHWNKLTVAHGCYWKQCTFCDVGLDYIGRYEATPSEILTDRIEALIAETGRRGFHFVDEAAPPAGLKALALILLERRVAITWWGNIRFELAFTRDLCRLLAASGCVAVTAGLEAASDRLLDAMKKGITVAQAARVAASFQAAAIMVHAYLMYGFPGETLVETVETLERVRQLFAHDLIQSAFWHRFVATAHSPIGLDPAAHGICITGPSFGGFAENDLTHDEPAGEAPEWLGVGLRAALSSYMRGEGLTANVRQWFDRPVPKPKVPCNWVARVLEETSEQDDPTAERRFVWIGGTPVSESLGRRLRRVILPNQTEDVEMRLSSEKADWLLDLIRSATPTREKRGEGYPTLREGRETYPLGGTRGFDALIRSALWQQARTAGLLLL
ncbi:MAG TPA: radical SAM protein [Nitrospirales bacterium]|nr:radical SAM protein [Nitrospirales bacterium]